MGQQTNRFAIKRLSDGRALLNLACGTRMDRRWNNLDFSPYARLASRPWLTKLLAQLRVLSFQRRERLRNVDPDIIAWNLRNGIPFEDNSFDVLYHSHFLEHLERQQALSFLEECCRVLRPGGVLRVVVPDLEFLINRYASALRSFAGNGKIARQNHEKAIEALFDQMVREDSSGATEQPPLLGWIERTIRGNATATGEVHRWMYDRYSLAALLEKAGFGDVAPCECQSSRVSGWGEFLLDAEPDGSPYKPESLYMEGTKR